jgi:quinol monooxygenase YgiN
MAMVQFTIKITAASGRAHELVDALHMLMARARQMKGCSGVHIAADLDEADAFWYCEDWLDRDALERRVKAESFSQFLALMETSAAPPSMEFRTVSDLRGLEYVSTVREAMEP